MKHTSIFFLFSLLFLGCLSEVEQKETKAVETIAIDNELSSKIKQKELILSKKKRADSFDFAVGAPDGEGYYNAQPFGENNHLGDDWNGVKGENSDLGDPIYAIANGYVKFAEDVHGVWGNVIRIIHTLPNGETYESLYAHCDKKLMESGIWVEKGQQIGTIGNASGQYLAHLHLEIRKDVNMGMGGGYAEYKTGYVDSTEFINGHRTGQ